MTKDRYFEIYRFHCILIEVNLRIELVFKESVIQINALDLCANSAIWLVKMDERYS